MALPGNASTGRLLASSASPLWKPGHACESRDRPNEFIQFRRDPRQSTVGGQRYLRAHARSMSFARDSSPPERLVAWLVPRASPPEIRTPAGHLARTVAERTCPHALVKRRDVPVELALCTGRRADRRWPQARLRLRRLPAGARPGVGAKLVGMARKIAPPSAQRSRRVWVLRRAFPLFGGAGAASSESSARRGHRESASRSAAALELTSRIAAGARRRQSGGQRAAPVPGS